MTTIYTTDFVITPGATYKFKVEARNSVGYSDFSNTVVIQAVQVPDTPDAPVVEKAGTETVVSWVAPYHGGSAITSYIVSFLKSDGSFTTSPTYCIHNDATMISEASCSVPSSHFVGSPFNLEWGDQVFAKIIASNWRGSSPESGVSNGVVILSVPDAPINLVNVPAITDGTTIGIEWEIGVEEGGTSVLDYRVSYDEGIGNEVVV